MSNRFDPLPDEPYGKCATCDAVMQTPQDSANHLKETFETAPQPGERFSHSVSVSNASRPTRISQAIGQIVEDAINEAMEEVDRLVESEDLTYEEAETALASYDGFSDAWEEWKDMS